MKKKVCVFLLTGVLSALLWSNAHAQEQLSLAQAQRLQLTLEDNESTFNLGQQVNEYRNVLRLSQSGSDYKLTAGLLSQGDNFITITRQGDTETAPTELARVNLNANIVKREMVELSDLTLTSTSVNQSGWSAYGLSSSWLSSGYYIASGNNNHLTYTIPAGYDDGIIILYIYTYQAGYFKINGTSGYAQTKANSWNQYVLSGLNSGDNIRIQGCASNGSNANSPRFNRVVVQWAPATLVPTISVTPTLSLKNGNGWGAPTSLGSMRAYQPNDNIDVDAMNVSITDAFTASTADNSHPTQYSYMADAPVNIDWTSADMGGNYYASIDFTLGDGDDVATAQRIGPDNWEYQLEYYYTPTDVNIHSFIMDGISDLIYTMPPTFAGRAVNVTVNSITGSLGTGNVVVNGVKKTFTAGSSQTWSVPVSANGTIRFQLASGDNYTCGITKIVIQSGNGTAQNAPQGVPAPSRGIMSGRELSILPRVMSVKK